MALPYFYRDYPLAIYMAIVVVVCGLVSLGTEPLQSVEITLANACCQAPRCPVVDSLTALPNAQDVRHQVSSNRSTISFRASRTASARQIWDAVEAAQHRPQRLRVGNNEFVSKPIR